MKNVIFHIDDIWSSKCSNDAAFDLFDSGIATSGSIMVPCKWFEDVVKRYKPIKEIDLWVHLTLTSEWKDWHLKWWPVTPQNEVPSLVDDSWYFYSSLDEVFEKASQDDIKKELSNQIIKTIDSGIPVSHIDSHMGVLLHRKLFHIYKELAELFNIQPFIAKPKKWDSLGNRFYWCDKYIYDLENKWFKCVDHYDADSLYNWNDFEEYEISRINKIQNWTTYFLLHVLWESVPNLDITPDAKQRQNEYRFFKSKELEKCINRNKIKRTNMVTL